MPVLQRKGDKSQRLKIASTKSHTCTAIFFIKLRQTFDTGTFELVWTYFLTSPARAVIKEPLLMVFSKLSCMYSFWRARAGIALLALLLLPIAAIAQQPSNTLAAPESPHVQTVAYHTITGVDPDLLSLDVYGASSDVSKPVVIMIHGGGWQAGDKANANAISPKAAHFVDQGYLFVSINYRLAPTHPFPAHANDAGRAVSWVHEHIADHGGDPARIHLMGHSAGAHIAALIATDTRYLNASGLGLDILKGVVLLDTIAYDIPALARSPRGLPAAYLSAFGNDPQGWRAASPLTHVHANIAIPPMILFHTERRGGAVLSQRFADALLKVGVSAVVYSASDRTHSTLNRLIGTPGDPYTVSYS